MTDNLSEYEKLAWRIRPDLDGSAEVVDAILELVAMVRETVGNTEHAIHQIGQWRERAEIAEADIAKLREALGTISEFAVPADSSRRTGHTELWKMTVNAMKETAIEALRKE